MNILGISAYYHDSASALMSNGQVVAAAQEERFSRIKHDLSFPVNAVVVYEKPLIKFSRIVDSIVTTYPHSLRVFYTIIPECLKNKIWIPYQLEQFFFKLIMQ